MRKREIKCLISLFVFLILVITVLSSRMSIAQQDPSDVAIVFSEQFNISKDKIPTDPEKIKQEYLTQEWTKIISENKFFGPIHKFFIKIPWFFDVFLAYPYEFSLTFFIILIIWLWIVFRASKTIESSGFIGGWKAFLVGVLVAVILSQLRIIKVVVITTLDLAFKPENWWMRLIIIVIVFGIIAMLHVISKMVEKKMKEDKKKKLEKKLELNVKKVENIAKEARDIYDVSDAD